MSQGHLFVSLLFWGLHFIFYRDFSLSVLLVKTSFWNSSRILKLMIFWYQKFSEKSVQKVTCLKVTHFWEFGRTQNASLFSTTVYIFLIEVTQFLPRNIIFASWIMDIFSQDLISKSQMHHLITCFEVNLLVNIMRFHSCIETRFEPTALTSFHVRT